MGVRTQSLSLLTPPDAYKDLEAGTCVDLTLRTQRLGRHTACMPPVFLPVSLPVLGPLTRAGPTRFRLVCVEGWLRFA